MGLAPGGCKCTVKVNNHNKKHVLQPDQLAYL